MLELIVICAVIGVIPGAIAQSKGHSFVGWWIYGALLFIVALPHSIMLKPAGPSAGDLETQRLAKALQDAQSRTCPFCAETIKREAIVCRYCGRDLPQAAPAAASASVHPQI